MHPLVPEGSPNMAQPQGHPPSTSGQSQRTWNKVLFAGRGRVMETPSFQV